MKRFHILYRKPNSTLSSGITIEATNMICALHEAKRVLKENFSILFVIACYQVDADGSLQY